jgi:DNA sulfur modification protein DndD
MKIDKLTIENYQCYFGLKTFEFSDGLNIVLGENGEGKTKFFEAVNWLFEGNDLNLDKLVSRKAIYNSVEGDIFKVMVSMVVRTDEEEKKTISKSFLVRKKMDDQIEISSFMIQGIDENKSGERTQVDGLTLLNQVFPFEIRKYSMFKGESELDIFKSEDALINLINLFSEAKHYNKYPIKGAFLREKAEDAVRESTNRDEKNKKIYKKLEAEIIELSLERQNLKGRLELTESEIKSIDTQLQDAGNYVNNASALEIINKRIQSIEDKITQLYNSIDENYTTSLFDENWIAVYFDKFHEEYSQKVTSFDHKRRKLQSEYDTENGKKEGEKIAKAELFKNFIPLPTNVPSKVHMEEMLNDQICKVCNREAKVGSEPYNFMMSRLNEYINSQMHHKKDEELIAPLFKYDYMSRLVHLSIVHADNLKNIRNIKLKIKDLFEFNEKRKLNIQEQENLLGKELEDRAQILGNSSLGEEKLINVLKNYNDWVSDLKVKNSDQAVLQSKIDTIDSVLKLKSQEKENIHLNSAQTFLIKTREILRDIETIFKDTKEKKFTEFVNELQEKSNSFFRQINVNAFTGNIVFVRNRISDGNTGINVELHENGQKFFAPNQSLLTSMHISVLLAISAIATETRQEKYPMIFDAPISSFGENKSAEFLNLMFETSNQKILLIKDFLVNDKETKILTIKPEFQNVRRNKAFWLKVERPFDPNDLKTIETKIITL